MTDERHLAVLGGLVDAFALELDRHRPDDTVGWETWPDVRRLAGHLGAVHRWATHLVRTGERAPQPPDGPAPDPMRSWFQEGADLLLDALRVTPVDEPCWVLAGDDRTAGFWRRRMVFETAKHLIDLRAAGGRPMRAPAELAREDAADGVDELFAVFLRRSRPTLAPLPGSVRLEATDTDRAWLVRHDWGIEDGAGAGAAQVRARAGDLALFLWDRADPLTDVGRFVVEGDPAAVAALRDAPIHV